MSTNLVSAVSMSLSIRFDRAFSECQTQAAAQQCREAGAGRVTFITNQAFDCTYGALEATSDRSADRIRQQLPAATVWDFSVIALAIEPSTSEALPLLEAAFGGRGKPAGIVRCEKRARSVILEIAEQRTSLALILSLMEVELRRFGNAGRRVHTLSPLPAEVQAAIAARGLGLARLEASQILELLIERPHV